MIRSRRPWILITLVVAAASIVGCSSVNDHLTINADGGGTVVIETTVPDSLWESQLKRQFMMMGEAPDLLYPPLNSDEADSLFPGEGFTINEQTQEGDGSVTVTISITFDDINKLLATPYARARSLAIRADSETGVLTVRCRSGLQAIGSTLAAIGEEELLPIRDDLSIDAEELQAMEDNFSASFTLTLPNPASGDEAAVSEGNSVSWSIANKDHETKEAYSAALHRIMTASCEMDGIGFAPATPPRLDLDTFDTLQEQTLSQKQDTPIDTDAVLKAAEVEPLIILAKRTSNYTGQSWNDENYGMVVAVLTLPKALEPLRWGDFKAAEVIDDRGNNLVYSDQDDEDYGRGGYGMMFDLNEDYGWGGEEDGRSPDQIDRYFNIQFQAPEVTARALTKVTGSIRAMYGGSPRIIKLPGIVKSITDEDEGLSYGSNSESEIDSPALLETNTRIRIQGTHIQGPGVMISLGIASEDAIVKDFQVFDAQGNACPTIKQSEYDAGDEQHVQLIVMGKPKPPLSMAVLVDAASTVIEIPVELADLSLIQAKEEEGE